MASLGALLQTPKHRLCNKQTSLPLGPFSGYTTMETLEVDSCIQGYHVFESIWNPTTGEELNCMQERANTEDPYAVAVGRRSAVVGHVP